MKRPQKGLVAIATGIGILLPWSEGHAINGGAATAANARAPHHTVGGTVWTDSTDLIEPCTAVLLCNNVILTAAHCLNMDGAPERYFSLEVDLNTPAGPNGVMNPNRFQRIKAEFGRNQNTTRRIDNDSVAYGESHGVPMPQGVPALTVGLAMAKLTATLPNNLNYPNIIPANFAWAQDPDNDLFDDTKANFLRPGNAATEGLVSGYGRSGRNNAGAGIMKNGSMRFLSWVEPRAHNPQGRTAPAAGSRNGFLLQFVRGQVGNAHGCPGDSGGPVFVASGGAPRLAGIRELVSDQRCAGGLLPNNQGHFDEFVSLKYTRNRTFIRNYMLANCDDRREIDLATGTNTPRPEQEWCSFTSSEPTEPEPPTEPYFNTEPWVQGWECWVNNIWNYEPDLGPQYPCSLPTPTPTVSPTFTPTETPTVTPTEEPTYTPTETPTVWPTYTPTETPTVWPTPTPTEEPTVSPTPVPTEEPTPWPTATATPI